MSEWHAQVKPQQDWRKEKMEPSNIATCNCKAEMKGKWVNGRYMCVRCDKPVYNA
ncbi:hypothetical protein [Paenibacillus sp. UMB4589-SE434]|uniref:hypothetical protein n=1 Tax=Paenibacillus sp. UMB4589-SE434 TaxID=3046314 RepID=UPI00254B159A|nr:hypothetical protein [Paenibacillus sp. UMB4589-SE434]MDK8182140.1 hypothetical protein [Paenibacillus sp. UMB4589-SE434]